MEFELDAQTQNASPDVIKLLSSNRTSFEKIIFMMTSALKVFNWNCWTNDDYHSLCLCLTRGLAFSPNIWTAAHSWTGTILFLEFILPQVPCVIMVKMLMQTLLCLPTEMVWIRLLTVFVSSCCCCFMAELSEEVRSSCCSISFMMLVCFSTSFLSCSFSTFKLSSSVFLLPSMSSTRFSRKLKRNREKIWKKLLFSSRHTVGFWTLWKESVAIWI